MRQDKLLQVHIWTATFTRCQSASQAVCESVSQFACQSLIHSVIYIAHTPCCQHIFIAVNYELGLSFQMFVAFYMVKNYFEYSVRGVTAGSVWPSNVACAEIYFI